MELKVWVEGIQRIVCGVTETTTCQDVVFALAHATGKIGRFTLIERWRNNERLLAPQENPLKILMKWGEYSSDVQFILQRSDQQPAQTQQPQQKTDQLLQKNLSQPQMLQRQKTPTQIEIHQPINQTLNTIINKESAQIIADDIIASVTTTSATTVSPIIMIDRNKENRKSLILNTMSQMDTIKLAENVGIVKGVVQQKPSNIVAPQKNDLQNKTVNGSPTSIVIPTTNSTSSGCSSNTTSGEFNTADIRNSLDRKINLMHTTPVTPNNFNNSNENLLLDVYNTLKNSNQNNISGIDNNNSLSPQISPIGGISANGALVPPPYRDPPPPRNSPLQQKEINLKKFNEFKDNINSTTQQLIQTTININDIINNDQQTQQIIINNNNNVINNNNNNNISLTNNNNNNIQYRDLIQLIKLQREKLNLQQADITKYDAEIIYLENKEREQIQQIEAITREINKTDQIYRQSNEHLQTLQYVEEENELVRQQEKTLKSEITLLRSKLANCETELLQCKNKIRILMDEIQLEQQRSILLNRHHVDQHHRQSQQFERHLIIEVDKIQAEIDLVIKNAETSTKTTDNLKKEVTIIECAIAEKKRQVEQLVNEMKEVNLQSLAVAPSEEIRHLLEGSHRPGSTRRIIGSPRQLENAVPTSKNPHGVWV